MFYAVFQDQQQTFAQGLRLWFDNFVDAAARDPTFNSSPSFQVRFYLSCILFHHLSSVAFFFFFFFSRCRADRPWECSILATHLPARLEMYLHTCQSFHPFLSSLCLLQLPMQSQSLVISQRKSPPTLLLSIFVLILCWESIRAFDVVLPANKTLSQYWAAVFGDYSVPLFILSGRCKMFGNNCC